MCIVKHTSFGPSYNHSKLRRKASCPTNLLSLVAPFSFAYDQKLSCISRSRVNWVSDDMHIIIFA